MQLSKYKRIHGHGCWKVTFSVRESCYNAILRVKLKYMKDVSFSWNWNVICNAEDRFHVFELFARASNVRASMHMNH